MPHVATTWRERLLLRHVSWESSAGLQAQDTFGPTATGPIGGTTGIGSKALGYGRHGPTRSGSRAHGVRWAADIVTIPGTGASRTGSARYADE